MTFAEDVRAGLSAAQKTLPSKYFYDAIGSLLFEAICQLPEYYLTRAEAEILRARAPEVIEATGTPLSIIELGSGSSVKTRYLIAAALARQPSLRYRPVDISASALETSASALTADYPGLIVDGVNADYTTGLGRISRNGSRRTLALFLGSNVGNFDPPEAQRLLRSVHDMLDPGDGFLLGADLKKDPHTLERAYDDSLGVTAAFNLNLLGRINRELGGRFELRNFYHRSRYNTDFARIESHLVSRRRQDVRINAIDMDVPFEDGEYIHTESSYKFDDASVARLADASGFSVGSEWVDPQNRFADYLLVAR
jgi:L-histidine Nalpha-methyltransferase